MAASGVDSVRSSTAAESSCDNEWYEFLNRKVFNELVLTGRLTTQLRGDWYRPDHFLYAYKAVASTSIIAEALVRVNQSLTVPIGRKCDEKSATYRLNAERFRQSGNHRSALDSFNLSVIYAVPALSDKEIAHLPTALSRAYNGRSQLLYDMKKYHECIWDTLLAMKHGCANVEISALYERLAHCSEQLGDFGKAYQCYQEAISASTEPKDIDRLQRLIQLAKDNPAFSNRDNEFTSLLCAFNNPSTWQPVPDLLSGASDSVPSLSNALGTGREGNNGAFAVATRGIEAACVVVVEKPLVWALRRQHTLLRCNGCSRKSTIVTPCRGCTEVVYCSQGCEDTAWSEYHALECPVLPCLTNDTLRLQFRALVKCVKEALAAVTDNGDNGCGIQDYEASDCMFAFDSLPATDVAAHARDTATSYRQSYLLSAAIASRIVLELVLKSRAIQRLSIAANCAGGSNADILRRMCVKNLAHLCAALCHNTQATFSARVGAARLPFTASQLAIPDLLGALLTSLHVLFRHHANEIRVTKPNCRTISIGSAFYPALARLEPSCYPHTIVVSHGCDVVLRVMRYVHQGERVTVPHRKEWSFPRFDFATRREKLFYRCSCVVCVLQLSASDQINVFTPVCSRCTAPVRIAKATKCRQCHRPIHSERSALSAALLAMSHQFGTTSRVIQPNTDDTCEQAERFLKVFAALDKRMAERIAFGVFQVLRQALSPPREL